MHHCFFGGARVGAVNDEEASSSSELSRDMHCRFFGDGARVGAVNNEDGADAEDAADAKDAVAVSSSKVPAMSKASRAACRVSMAGRDQLPTTVVLKISQHSRTWSRP